MIINGEFLNGISGERLLSWKIWCSSWKNGCPSWNFGTTSWKNQVTSWNRENMENIFTTLCC